MIIKPEKIRNVAIIAHVDHGKTTLVDRFFHQSGLFRSNQITQECLMDSMDLERERGITITSKNGAFAYKNHWINIIDTPGHADFGGQVERVLRMADGALLLVDAKEGPMPQTYFVLKKALRLELPLILVINKLDKPDARPDWVIQQVEDLILHLEAPEHLLDFPILYASAKDGYAVRKIEDPKESMMPLLDEIIHYFPSPKGNSDDPLQLQVSSIDYSSFMGRLGIGKVTGGTLKVNQDVLLCTPLGEQQNARITQIYRFQGNKKEKTDIAVLGEIVAVAGVEDVSIGDTYTDPLDPCPLPGISVDPPTISMNFIPNDSPFFGKEGTFVTSRHLRERLFREILSDVALKVEELKEGLNGFKVSGRGELHLSILIEKMRREGYEFQVTAPEVIFKEEAGKLLEPYERLTIDVAEAYMGVVIEKLGVRKAQMLEMHHDKDMVRLTYKVPTRGLLGFKSEFMSDTRGMGVMNYVFLDYGPHAGEMRKRKNGALVVKERCSSVAYALFNLQNRGKLFIGPGADVYEGQIIGEHSRENDLVVNPAKGKKLTNVRASGSDESVILVPPVLMTLEECINFINADELVEVTPKSIRIRKREF